MNPLLMSLNGQYIIPDGFQIMEIGGRETISQEISDEVIGDMDGSQLRYKRTPSRVITVGFRIICNSTAWWSVYNNLVSSVNVKDAQIIFSDEPDKYFVGSFQDLSLTKKVVNGFVYGKMKFLCTDPFKYSVIEKKFTAQKQADGSYLFDVTNNGNAPCNVRYKITHGAAGNGYIAIVSDKGAIQLGDNTRVSESAPRLNYLASSLLSGQEESGGGFQDASLKDTGNFELATYQTVQHVTTNAPYDGSGFCGSSATYELPISANADDVNFTISTGISFYAGRPGQHGVLQAIALDENHARIGKWNIVTNNDGVATLYCGTNSREQVLDKWVPSNGTWGDYSYGGFVQIIKKGATLKFVLANKKGVKTATFETSEYQRLKYVALYIGYIPQKITELGFNHLVVIGEDKLGTFRSGEVVEIDSRQSKVWRSGVLDPDLEAVGSSYFKIDPGTSKIAVLSSSWNSSNSMTCECWIRERWL